MSQKPSSSPSPFLHNIDRSRPRSNSVIRLMSSQNPSSSSPTQQSKNFKRSMSVSEGLHVRLPTLHHTETEPFPYSPVTQQTTNNICPSESNWANKYEDFDIGKPIGKCVRHHLSCCSTLALTSIHADARLWIVGCCVRSHLQAAEEESRRQDDRLGHV